MTMSPAITDAIHDLEAYDDAEQRAALVHAILDQVTVDAEPAE